MVKKNQKHEDASDMKRSIDIWAMEMEHYLEYIDNEVWKGNSLVFQEERISQWKKGCNLFPLGQTNRDLDLLHEDFGTVLIDIDIGRDGHQLANSNMMLENPMEEHRIQWGICYLLDGSKATYLGKGKNKSWSIGHHNMYSFDMKTPSPAKGFACLIAKATSDESKLWHRRLGHINFKNLNKLVKGNLVRGLPSKVFKYDHTCVACHKGKQHRASCKAKLERLITVPLHTLHMDLFGPTSVKSINHASYCLVITDDCTRFSWVFFLASKDETSGILQTFIRQIENQLSHRVKIIRSDNGTEFKNRDMLEFCGNKGIKQEYITLVCLARFDGISDEGFLVKLDPISSGVIKLDPHAGCFTELTNSAGTPTSIASEEKDKEVELIVVPSAVQLEEIALKHLGTVPENNTTSTPSVNTGSQTANTGRLDHDDSLMPELEIFHKPETGIFDEASYDEDGCDNDSNRKNLRRLLKLYKMTIGFKPCKKNYYSSSYNKYGSVESTSWNKGDGTQVFIKVVKALYGQHQAPRAWYATLLTFLEKHGYKRGTIDKTLFIKRDKKDIMLVQVYVDDIIFGSTSCLQVKQHKGGIFISQDKYVAEILKKFDLVNVKAAITPMETKVPLTKDEEAFDVDVHLYRSMIGSLMYLTASRPDIMYAVCVCSRFQVTPKTSHLNAVKRIFKYLKGKPNLGLWYPRESPFDLEAFSDSDYGGSNLDRKSTTGGCQFLGQRLISWQCKKQTIVATSTTEAEYVAAANCCGQNPVYHSKTKHIEIRHHFIRDCYEKKLISVEKIHTDLNVADLLTKPGFDGPRFNYLVVSIGFAEIVDFLRGSNLRYALTTNPTIYDSLIKQFWQTATANTNADGTLEIQATLDTIRYTIYEASVRDSLQLEDASGITMLPNGELFEGMRQIGYPTDGTFTFWKSFFTPQWRYLVHYLLHCISSKSGGWDQFGSNIATALICSITGQEHADVAPSQPSSSTPQVQSHTPTPPPIHTPTPTPPPIHTPTPTPPPIHTPTPTPPPIHTPTPTPPPIHTPTPTPPPIPTPTPIPDLEFLPPF
ncbi:putative ribonuclease H-like domain-containing protein [Tanacetum coccineum]